MLHFVATITKTRFVGSVEVWPASTHSETITNSEMPIRKVNGCIHYSRNSQVYYDKLLYTLSADFHSKVALLPFIEALPWWKHQLWLNFTLQTCQRHVQTKSTNDWDLVQSDQPPLQKKTRSSLLFFHVELASHINRANVHLTLLIEATLSLYAKYCTRSELWMLVAMHLLRNKDQ